MSNENNFVPQFDGYKKITPFRLFVKSNFPFIESTYEALDNYGLYCKIVEYLNKVIENENNVETDVENMYKAFENLNEYVNNYFISLDVDAKIKDEVNDKLDEMATDGTLYDIINQEIMGDLNNRIEEINTTLTDEIDDVNTTLTNEIQNTNNQVSALMNNYSDIFTNPLNKFVMIGDSLADGYGWWGGNINNKNEQNEGLTALLKNDYPNASINNIAVSGSTIANIVGHPNLQTQVNQVPNNTTHCFIMTGINDVTFSINDKNNYIGYPKDRVLASNYLQNDYTTTCNAFESNIRNLLQKNNNMKIYLLIEPTTDNDNYYLYNMCFSFLKFICDKYGVNVVDFRQMFRKYYEPYSSQYFFDKVHLNQNGYNYIYPYFRNHIRQDINDNFTELPQCLITDVDFNFESNQDEVSRKMYDLAQEITEKATLWQQNFETLILNINDLSGTSNKTAILKFTFNFVWCKIDILSLIELHRYNFTFYAYSNKKYGIDSSDTTIIKPNWNIETFSSDITNDMNITDISQMKWIGTYKIDWNKLEQITNLHSDLRSSNNGWAICEVITYDSTYIVQRWTSLMKKDYIYMAYIIISNNTPTVEWRKIPLQY